MIRDTETLERLRSDWAAVVRMRGRMEDQVRTAFLGTFRGLGLADIVYNLPLMLAFGVLRSALRALEEEGHFVCSGKKDLKPLLIAAQDALQWIGWQRLLDGAGRRNQIAHDGLLFTSAECISDLDAVQAQLLKWGVA